VLIQSLNAAAWSYVAGCAVVCVVAAIQRWQWRRHPERHGALSSNHTRHINVADHVSEPLTAPGIPTWLSRVPGNEVLSICIQEKELVIPRLSPQNEGLRIVHLSDLHMSGRIRKAYFEHVVDEVNRCEPDFVAITGDLVECDECLAWIPDTLGRLRATSGVYYVLGNHDRRINEARLKAALASAGLIHLGGAWREITVRDTPLILAGNELPWYGPAADMSDCPQRDAAGLPLRILLAHTPDQFSWAQENDIDLMLAGHLHGGQVCLPLLGAMTSPSLQGVRYAAGTFRAGNTVLHVSRGTSSLTPLRWNCAPEVAVLNLRVVC
jgi:predicted MPP superfamily phosphohydrolase